MTDYPDLTHRQRLIIFGGLMLGMLLAALDQTIVAASLPRITGDLGGLQHISWVISAYMLASTVGMPLYGKLGDLFGRKLLFQISISVFLVGSVLSGMSQSMVQLIAFRAVQGLGGGGLMVLAMAIIGETVPPRERGRYQGYFGAAFGVSSIVGPLIGGFITDNLSWRWVFYVNIPVGIIALIVTSFVIPKGERHERPQIDFLGAALMTAAVTMLVLGTTWGGTRYAWASPVILGLAAATVLAITAFLFVERRTAEPVLPLHLFRISTFRLTTSVSFILGLALFGSMGFLPLFLQVVTGASATNSGLAMFPMMAGVLVASVISGTLISRTGRYKPFPVVGTALAVVAFVLLSTIGAGTSRLTVSAFMFVLGSGIGLTMQVMVLACQNAVPLSVMGSATAAVSFFREIGGAIGIATAGAVFSNSLTHRLGTGLGRDSSLSIDRIRELPAAQESTVVHAIADSVAHIFLFAGPIMAVAALLTWALRELPLRETAVAAVEHGATIEVVPEFEVAS